MTKTLDIDYGFINLSDVVACGYEHDSDVHVKQEYKYRVKAYMSSGHIFTVGKYSSAEEAIKKVRELQIMKENLYEN